MMEPIFKHFFLERALDASSLSANPARVLRYRNRYNPGARADGRRFHRP